MRCLLLTLVCIAIVLSWLRLCACVQLLAPRFIGYLLAITVVFVVFFWLQYLSAKKRNKSKGGV